jgi:hypothetical protein
VAATPTLMAATPPPNADASSPPDGSPRGPLARRWWLNLILLVVVAGLGLFAWYRSAHPPEDAKPRLTDVSADAVQTVEIEGAQKPVVRLERGGDGWRLVAPIKARADTLAVESLLRLLRAPVEGTVAQTDADLARYGLNPPKLQVHFDATVIAFGERHPLKDEQYVKHGSAVHLISSQYYTQAAAPYTNLLDSRLIEPGRKLVALKLPDFTLRQKDGAWVRTPEIKTLSSDRINAFVDEWRHARALRIQKHTDTKPAQEHVVATFAKPDGGETDLNIDVLARKPELVLYRHDENLEYHFPESIGERLLTLREKAKVKN